MDTAKAARLTMEVRNSKDKEEGLDGDPIQTVRNEEGRGVNHAYWMLTEIVLGNVTEEKAHRWLGYAQALLVAEDELTLEECKAINKEA